ncbi:MAG TPA: VTT domain-containing protein [Burkholderiales bacterium]|jgi:membrane protein DedA with SNARE-associated domain|nr:VTT domain-containing protein [Burkholderiales bacterium]
MEPITSLLAQYGLVLVFANVLLTQLGAPVPATPILILAGSAVGNGQLAFGPALGLAMLATLLGNMPWYFAGRRYGYPILRTLCRISIEPDSCVKRTEDIFGRWGALSLIVGKYIPGFATIAPPLAGAMRIGLPRFIAYTVISALLWAVVPLLAGMVFRTEVDWLLARLEDMGLGALILVAVVVAVYVAVKSVERYLLIRFLRMTRISVNELRELMNGEERPVVLDVRSTLARQLDSRRLPGAIAVDIDAQAALLAVPPDRDVVIYCS